MCLAQGHNVVTPERPEIRMLTLLIAAHSTKVKMRGSREGAEEGPDHHPGISQTFGALKQYWSRSPLENQKKIPSQLSIFGNYMPASVLLLGF